MHKLLRGIPLFKIVVIFMVLFSCKAKQNFVENNRLADIDIMSFNIRYANEDDKKNKWVNRKVAVVEMLKETQPSIIGIQEGLKFQVDYLLEHLPEYKQVGVGRNDGKESGEYCAILYLRDQFECIKDQTFWLSETPEEPSKGWDANSKRIVTWVHLKDKKTNKAFFVFNTHLDHKGKVSRRKSMELLQQQIDQITPLNTPVFITGDFNALAGSPIFKPLLKTYKDARKAGYRSDFKKSYNSWGKWYVKRNIDYIFYKHVDNVSFKTVVKDYGVPYISDHYPILAGFRMYSN